MVFTFRLPHQVGTEAKPAIPNRNDIFIGGLLNSDLALGLGQLIRFDPAALHQ